MFFILIRKQYLLFN